MLSLARRVLRGLRRRELLHDAERVALALSGGSDSVALVWLLQEMASAGHIAVAGLVHLNHGLRGEESNGDEVFCRALAARIGWPIDVEEIDAAALARAQSQSVETAGRAARYRFFEAAAQRLGADVVMTGHTLDDQAETVLLRLLRGAGTRGLGGVRPRRGPYVRPLLDVRRAELRQYLVDRGESFRDDSSNRDLSVPRNRIRHELMPVISRLAPGGVRALARVAALARDDEDFLQKAAIEAGRSLVLSDEARRVAQAPPASTLRIDCRMFAVLPPALGRRVVRELLLRAAPGATFSARHIEAVRELAFADKSNGHLDLPGLAVERRAGVLSISSRAGAATPNPAGRRRRLTSAGPGQGARRPLEVPGAVEMPEAGVTIAASMQVGESAVPPGTDKRVAMLQASSLMLPLAVRTRRPGDRFRPLGAPGRRKLQDLLVDRKVPREAREIVPLVVDAADRIVWVVGVAIAEECRVTSPGAGVVILKVGDLGT
jgi:tRNA(Ile)-lysidine synthase